ncbi:MAG: flagellar biosynthesis anti-sigma factor FlgM [Candidatus Lernaella stagnicola]|nr:flagellar biosynthesis anti-sigma factor FlgM [Candidatus Lernaella stagnicola]
MKVQNENVVQIQNAVHKAESKTQNQAVNPEQAAATMPEEKVTFSEEAVSLQQIGADVKAGDEVRMALVNKIKAEVEAGTYERPADKIAEAMINTSLIESLYR